MAITYNGSGYSTGRKQHYQGQRWNGWNGGSHGGRRPYYGRNQGYRDNRTYSDAAKEQQGPQHTTTDALSVMAATLKEVLCRLLLLEGRGPARAQPAAQANATKPSGPRHTDTTPDQVTRSDNINFASVCKVLYRSVQLEHHLDNWKQLPEKLSKRLQSFVADIKPPMVDDLLKAKLARVTEEYGRLLCGIVRQHLEEKAALNDVDASGYSSEDVYRAKLVAEGYVNTRLGNKINPERKGQLLEQAVRKIGTLVGMQPATSNSATAAASSSAAVDQDGFQQQRKRKVTAGGSASQPVRSNPPHQVSLNNTFNILRNVITDGNVITDDEDDDDTFVVESPEQVQAQKKTKTSVLPGLTLNKEVVIHSSKLKDKWEITAAPDTRVLVIGDSNLRNADASKVPRDWEMHAFPGAKYQHVTEIAKKQFGTGNLRHIVIQVGINHRDDNDVFTNDCLKKLEQELEDRAPYITFCGIPTAATMDAGMKGRIHNTNDVIKKTAFMYLTPPKENEVRILPEDRWGIHHDQESTDSIVSGIVRHVESLN